MVEQEDQPVESLPVAQFIPPLLRGLLYRERGHRRAGITKNHGQPRNKQRVRITRESRRKNRK